MKMAASLVCFTLAVTAVHSLRLAQEATPVARVVGLLSDLEAKIEKDGKSEQASYDKYACWCESTLGRKANDISTAKELLVDLESEMKKLSAEIASHGAEIQQVKKDIAANLASTREANEVRDKDYMEYKEGKLESEQCIGALEAAIGVLSGAGAGKKGFLATLEQGQVLGVVDGIRGVLRKLPSSVTEQDMAVVRKFVEHPEDFLGGHASGMSAAQIANNPFGDYAPQSSQIQGILKGMYDTFTTGLEKANADEAEEQKSFEALMAIKMKELATLKLTLETHNLDKAEKTKKLADSKQLFDDTQVQLAADEKFFSATKGSCKSKASEWAERIRLRTEELHGIAKAIDILSSPEAQAIFENATTTFLQLSTKSSGNGALASGEKAFAHLRSLAKKYRSLDLAELASQVQDAGAGHFDEVIASIDKMVSILRQEEKMDIDHRDRCQGATNKNTNDMEDLAHSVSKSGQKITRLGNDRLEIEGKITVLEEATSATNADMIALFNMRNQEHTEFVQGLKADADAVELLQMAIVAMSKFYTKNKIAILVQQPAGNYTVDPDKAPETTWDGAEYGGRQSESTGLLAILGMIKDDLQKEMQTARADEAEAQTDYKDDEDALHKLLMAQKASKLALDKEIGGIDADKQDTQEKKTDQEASAASEKKLESALYSDCSWVKTHFDSRASKRKVEMDGLVEAKDYLAGGDDI